MPSALAFVLVREGTVQHFIDQDPCCFVPGSSMLRNIAQIETDLYHGMLVGDGPAASFFDCAAASPSVTHPVLFLALRFLFGPLGGMCRCIENLYNAHHHILRHAVSFTMRSTRSRDASRLPHLGVALALIAHPLFWLAGISLVGQVRA